MKNSFFNANRTLLKSPDGWLVDLKNFTVEKDGWLVDLKNFTIVKDGLVFKFSRSDAGKWPGETLTVGELDMQLIAKDGVEGFVNAIKKSQL